MTIKTALIRELTSGWLTPLGALERCRCLSLSQRVGELRRSGYTVADKWVTLRDKRVKTYHITKVPK